MTRRVHRREFLKGVTAAAGTLAFAAETVEAARGAASARPGSSLERTPRLDSDSYEPCDYPIQAKLFSEVQLNDTFWKPRVERNAAITIPFELQALRDRPRGFGNNVLQAAVYSLATTPNPQVRSELDGTIQRMTSTFTSARKPSNEEFELAAALFLVLGRRDLLDHAIASANALYSLYETENPPFSGGERDAINCVALYRVTQERRYLDLAKHYLDIRGLSNSVDRSRHNQSFMPVLEQSEAVGHAVNDASLMVSLVDVGTLTGISGYFDAAQRLWTDVVTSKLYITGGIGSTGNEGFGAAYSLPNLSAYCETCAAAMFATFNLKMFLATGDGKYIDVMERTIYNNLADGIGVDGKTFFYVNRLASASDGRNVRWQHASLECCPPNIARFMASMSGYIYAQRGAEIFVNLYVASTTQFTVADRQLRLSIEGGMPWSGSSKITIASADPVQATLKLRIPGWARGRPVPGDLYSYANPHSEDWSVRVNGQRIDSRNEQQPDSMGYLSIERRWLHGDVVEIDFPLEVHIVVAHRNVRENLGRVAVERGPMVYCAEWPDRADGKVLTAVLDPQSPQNPAWDEDLFGGVTVIEAIAHNISAPQEPASCLKLIPYPYWANRGVGEMTVWLSQREYAPGDVGPAGGLIFYVNNNSEQDGWRYLEAAPFDQSTGAPWGSFRVPLEGARGSTIGAGRQNTVDIRKGCSTPGIAADLCAGFKLNGFQDWFLPSFDELKEMYIQLKVAELGNFTTNMPDNCDYWSSTQVSTDMARHIDFADNGLRGHFDDKDYPRRVRAIRAF